MTSILCTYYTWQTVETLDTSWDLIFMGLWTWAELSTGIIVGCLPALPKFFQHVGPKIYRTIPGTGPRRNAGAAIDTPQVIALAKFKTPFAKYGLGPSVSDSSNDPYSIRARLQEGSVILDGSDVSVPHSTTFSAPNECPGQDIATARNDLEYGQRGT